jgi:hypothetical protein
MDTRAYQLAHSAADMEAFREHARKLREDGATEVVVGDMAVKFDRPWPAALAAAIASPPPAPEPEPTDEDYVP